MTKFLEAYRQLSGEFESVKTFGIVLAFFGISLTDILVSVQIAVGVVTFIYVAGKARKVWRKDGNN